MRATVLLDPGLSIGARRALRELGEALERRGYALRVLADEADGLAGFSTTRFVPSGGWIRQGWRLRGMLSTAEPELVIVSDAHDHRVAATAFRLGRRGMVIRRVAAGGRLVRDRETAQALRSADTTFLFAAEQDVRGPALGGRAYVPALFGPRIPVATAAAPAATPVIAFLCDAVHRPQLTEALRAFGQLAQRHPTLELLVIGPDASDDALRIQAAALGIAGRLRYLADGEARLEALATARCVWIAAEGDDAVYAAIDAAVAGVPVLTVRDAVIGRWVEDGRNGRFLPRVEHDLLAARIAEWLADEEGRGRFASAARQCAVTWRAAAGETGLDEALANVRDGKRWAA